MDPTEYAGTVIIKPLSSLYTLAKDCLLRRSLRKNNIVDRHVDMTLHSNYECPAYKWSVKAWGQGFSWDGYPGLRRSGNSPEALSQVCLWRWLYLRLTYRWRILVD